MKNNKKGHTHRFNCIGKTYTTAKAMMASRLPGSSIEDLNQMTSLEVEKYQCKCGRYKEVHVKIYDGVKK